MTVPSTPTQYARPVPCRALRDTANMCVFMRRSFPKARCWAPCRARRGQAAPAPAAHSGCGAGRVPRGAAAGLRGGKEPTEEYVESLFPLISFHKSLSLVSFSSPTGSREIELIMFQILEKSGITGAPSTLTRSASRRGCLD